MLGEWVTAAEGRIMLGCSERVVRLTASRLRWQTRTERGNGGERKLFRRSDVLAYKARRDGTLPADLVIPDTSPVLSTHSEGAYADAPAAARQRTEERVAVVLAWEEWQQVQRTSADAFLAAWNGAHPDRKAVSRARLYAWWADWKRGGADALVPGWYTRQQSGIRIDPRLEKYFAAAYLRQQRPSVSFCYKATELKARELGIDIPSEKTFRRYVDAIPEVYVVLGRYGTKAYLDKCSPYTERDFSTIDANSYWTSDHHQLDIICIGPDGRLMRPWITVWEDVRTQACLGWAVVEAPNSTSIWLSFMRAAMAYGLPQNILIDNGKDYRSKDIAGGRVRTIRFEVEPAQTHCLVGRLGIQVHFAIPYNARSKAAERMFREVKEHFSKSFESYCGGHVLEKPEQLQALVRRRDGLPTFLDVEAAFGEWMPAVYNTAPCSREGMPRIEAWRALLKEKRTTTPENLYLLALRSKRPVLVRRGKITLFDRPFDCTDYPEWEGREVVPRYDPMNIAQVHLYDTDDRPIGLVGTKGLIPWGATEEDHRKEARIKARHRNAAKAGLEALVAMDETPNLLADIVEGRKAATAAASAGPRGPEPEPPVLRPPQWPKSLPERLPAVAVANGGWEEIPPPSEAREEFHNRAFRLMELVQEKAAREGRIPTPHTGESA